MGILGSMQFLNIRHQLPEIGIRQKHAIAEKNGYVPATMKRNYVPPKADVHTEQVKVEIDSYPSRTAYGFLNNTDFAAKYGQEGYTNIGERTSSIINSAWSYAKNAAKPGHNEIAAQAKAKLRGEILQWPGWEAKLPPSPTYTVTPAKVEGKVDPGSDTYDIQTSANADIAIKAGSAETYMKQKGYVRMWTSEGRYDIYA